MSTVLVRMLIFGTIAVLAACSSDQELDRVSGRVRVRMPWTLSDLSLKSSDPIIGSGSADAAKQKPISLQFIEISELKDLKRVQGLFAEFLLYPQLSGKDLSGTLPEADFFKLEKDKYVAKNILSLQMAVLYAHAERLQGFDKMLGINVNSGPRQIAITDLEDRGEVNNAFYHGETDAMFFLPFSGSTIATLFNPGIYAHEHFHSIFYKLVHQPLIDSKVLPKNMNPSLHGTHFGEHLHGGNTMTSTLGSVVQNAAEVSVLSTLTVNQQNYAKILIQGLNEGVADFWGWAYTGNPDFIALSLPSELEARSLNSNSKLTDPFFRFPPRCVLQRFVEDVQSSSAENKPAFVKAKAYEFGTAFSRIMKLYTESVQVADGITNPQARIKVAKQLAEFLPQLKSYYTSQLSQMIPIDLFKQFALSQKMNLNQCQFMLKVLNAPLNDGGFKYICEESADKTAVLKQTSEAKEEFCQ